MARLKSARLSAAAVLIAALLPATPAAAGVFNPESFTLANGLEVVVVENHRVPAVTQMVWYRVGAADEPVGKSGVAHYLEHLMFKGTDRFPPGEFSRLVAESGGRENAFTAQDYTGYYQTVARDRLELVMDLEADRMTNLLLSAELARPELAVVLEERRSRIENDPGSRLGEQLGAALYLNHPYGTPIIGWMHEVAALTPADAIDFYERHYAPNNAVLVFSGDVTAEELRPLVEKYYGAIPAREIAPRVRPAEPPPEAARRVTVESAQVQQPSWSRSYLAPSYITGEAEHAYPLEVLAEVFGGSATSQLYRRLVVERKLAVAAGAYYSPGAIDQTQFSIYVTPRNGVGLDEIEAAVDEEIAALLADGVDAAEVARARERLQAAAIYARDGLQAGARSLGMALAAGRTVEDVEAWPDRIGAVTAEAIDLAARAVLRPARSVTGLLLPAPAGEAEAPAGEEDG